MARTSEDQDAIQRPDIAKDSEIAFDFKKYTARTIDENIDSAVVFKCHTCILKWVALKHRCICALISREMQIEVGVLLEGDTCTALVTIEVPKDFRKRRTSTELL